MTQPAQTARHPLTRGEIAQAAVSIADRDGLAAVSMRKVGQAVGVEAMSLYHHVRNKEQVLDAMADLILTEAPLAAPGPWRDTLRAHAHATRELFARHPWAATVLNSRREPSAAALARHDAILGALRQDGLPWSTVASAISAVDAYTLGFVLAQQALPFDSPQDSTELGTQMLAQAPLDQAPHFAQFLAEHVLTPQYDHRAEFDRGLDLLLTGLAAL